MKNNFGNRLAELMLEKEIDSNKLAYILGVTAKTVNNWKTNKTDIWLKNLVTLCKFFNCSLEYLAGRTNNDTKFNKITIDNFGKRIRDIMKSKGITTYRIRKDAHLGSRYLHDWEKGAEPKLNTLIGLADYFDCTLDELVGFE